MFQPSARKRLIAATVIVFCALAVVLEFGTVSKADKAPPMLTPVMTAEGLDSVVAKTLVTKPGSKIAPEVLADMAGGDRVSVLIMMADQADVSAAYAMKDQDARGWYVYNTLSKHAERTQADIRSFLTAQGVEFQAFWAANMLVATVDRTLAEQLASRSDVARIDSNRSARWIEDPAIADKHDSPDAPDTIEWNVSNVNAPAVWAMGFNGQGIVVGDLDTGMRWTHVALKPKYRGWNGTTADHNFNWHDSIHSGGGTCGFNTQAPCDDNGHGSHTAGSMVGDDGTGDQVGVAPGAKWIGCRNMDQGNGMPSTYTECFQFAIAPTDLNGNNANPTLRPHVLNNSWGCPTSEGCTTGAELETIVNNTQAAGIFVEVSAGNSGPGCSSVSDPPAIYNASFSTGAISISNALASFSSRGPSLFYTPNLLKPNISAPGVGVRSSYGSSDTNFSSLSGTSMAGPHVCGVVALLWSARPQLSRDIAATKTLLQNTANPGVTVTAQTCGGTPSTAIPNNSFGYGRVDALAAVNAAGGGTPTPTGTPTNTPMNTPTATPTGTPGSGTISGTVTYGNAIGAPTPRFVSNVLVSGAGSPPVSNTTNGGGSYFLSGFGSGAYTITPSKTGAANGAITSFDAAKIAQFAAGLITLSPAQQTVADVSGNGSISSFDSALVGEYTVSIPNAGSTGNWIFGPASNTHATVTSNITGEDYLAFLMGEVSGNWTDAGARLAAGGAEKAAAVNAPHLVTPASGDVIVPVSIQGAPLKNIISYEFDLRYDPAVLQPQANPVDTAGTISRKLGFAVNAQEPGLLRVAVYGPTPLDGNGILLDLRFTAVGTPGSVSPLTWSRIIFNEGDPETTAVDGQVELSAALSN